MKWYHTIPDQSTVQSTQVFAGVVGGVNHYWCHHWNGTIFAFRVCDMEVGQKHKITEQQDSGLPRFESVLMTQVRVFLPQTFLAEVIRATQIMVVTAHTPIPTKQRDI